MSITRYARIRRWMAERGEPAFRVQQLWDGIFRQRNGRFAAIHTLPQGLRKALAAQFGEQVLDLKPLHSSQVPQTEKLLFATPDGQRIETVKMRYRAGWQSVCLSSQAGCNLGCPFCATGKIGLKRSLTADEIADQVLYFHLRGERLGSLSFMGMGEALANPALFEALHILTDPQLFGFSPRRLTVSTVGVLPNMQRLTTQFPQVNLTFSLHTPFPAQRDRLVPLNQTYPLGDILDHLDRHIQRTGRKVYLAYVLLKDVNDSPAHAHGLVHLVRQRFAQGRHLHVNLIRHHPQPGLPDRFRAPSTVAVRRFVDILRRGRVKVTLRGSFGLDVAAACGQLVANYAVNEIGVSNNE